MQRVRVCLWRGHVGWQCPRSPYTPARRATRNLDGFRVVLIVAPRHQLDNAAIDRERRVILREMEEVNSVQEEVIFDMLHDIAFPDSGLGRTILGPTENILKITRDDLESYIKTHYSGPRVVVAGAGAVDHEQVRAACWCGPSRCHLVWAPVPCGAYCLELTGLRS